MQLKAENFQIVREIGDGAFGKCMFAKKRNEHIGEPNHVVLKQVSRKNTKVYENECRILSGLHYPFIIGFRGQFTLDEHLFIVMDYAAGGSLSKFIKDVGVRRDLVFAYFMQLTHALFYLHSQDILHRDVKPDNIFLNWSQTYVLLGDFGSAIKQKEANEKDLIGSRGTREYCSIEVLSGLSPATDKCDMWSLGCVLYEMLERKPAFKFGSPFDKIENCDYPPMSSSTDILGKFLVEKLIVDHNIRWSAKDILKHQDLHDLRLKVITRHWRLYEFNENDGHGLQPIHFAVIDNQLDTVRRLHEQGFDLESTDCFGFTPLMCAAAEGHFEIVHFLLQSVINPWTENSFGMDAMTIASLNDHQDIFCLLESQKKKPIDEKRPKHCFNSSQAPYTLDNHRD